MKKTYLKSFCARCLTLLVLALLSTNLAWGDEVTFTPNSETSTASVTISPVTFTFTNGSTNTTWYNDGLRFYEGATITVSSENTITKIEFTHGVGNNGCLVLDDSSNGTYSSKIWSGSAKSIKFKVTHSSGTKNGQVKLTKVVVTYADSKTKAYLKFESAEDKDVYFGSTLKNIAKVYSDNTYQNELTGIGTISYSSSNEAYVSVASDGTISPVKEGYANIRASYSSESYSADAIEYKAIAKYKYDSAPTMSASATEGEKDAYKFTGKLQITLTMPDGTSKLYYTINDGEQQTYTEPFEISETSQINAWASDADGLLSKNKKLTYTKVSFFNVTLADENVVLRTSFDSPDKVILPTRFLDGYTFEGWSETNCSEATKTKPTIIEAGEYSPTTDITLYPIFSYSNGGSGEQTAESTTMTASTDEQALETGKPIKYKMSASNSYSNPLRIYSGNTITFEGALISKIVLLDASSGNPITNLNLNDGQSGSLDKTDGNVTWTGSANKVVLKASAQARTSKITVYYTAAEIFYVTMQSASKVSVSSAGWATVCLPFKATITSGNATAYYVMGTNEAALIKSDASVIPAGEGVLLKSNDSGEATVTFTISDEDADPATGNMMKGAITETTFDESGYKYYILANGENGLGFYYQGADNTTGASVKCAAGKAILAVPTTSGAKAFFSLDNEPTGIENPQSSTLNPQPSQYNLNGMRVNGNYKGIVIMNGKKYINK